MNTWTFAFAALIIEILFFVYYARWISQSKRDREAEYDTLDNERLDLLHLQRSLTQEVASAKSIAEIQVQKLHRLAIQAEQSLTEFTNRANEHVALCENHIQSQAQQELQELNRCRLGIQKLIQESNLVIVNMQEQHTDCHKTLSMMNNRGTQDDVVSALQSQKYETAKQYLLQGFAATEISKKLGMSVGEVSLLSHYLNN